MSKLSVAANHSRLLLPVIHFNDVYNLPSSNIEPSGGAARFHTAVQRALADFGQNDTTLEPLILFSGDALSPSTISNQTKGKHMVPVLNRLGVHASVIGNHDYDLGVDALEDCLDEFRFPWLLSNCLDLSSEPPRPLGSGRLAYVLDWCGVRIGLVGLVEEEWVTTLGTVDGSFVRVIDFIESGRALAIFLKAHLGCDLVFALGHLRWGNDEKLAAGAPEIDLVFGGHDHDSGDRIIGNHHVIKSGADFKQFRLVTLELERGAEPLPKDISAPKVRVSELYGDIVHTTNVLARGECPYRVVKFERTELDEGLKASAVSDSSEDEELLQMLAKGTNPRQVDANAVRVDVVERAQLPAHTPAFRLASVSTVEHTVDSSVTEDTEMKKIVDFYYEAIEKRLDEVLGIVDVELDARFSEIRTHETNAGNLVCDAALAAVQADAVLINAGILRADCLYAKGPFRQRDLERLLPFQTDLVVVGIKGEQIDALLEAGVSKWPQMEGRFPQVGRITFNFDGKAEPGQRIHDDSIQIGGVPVEKGKSEQENMPTLNLAVRNYLTSLSILRGDTKSSSIHRASPIAQAERSEIADKASRAGAARKALLLSFKAAAQLIEEGYSLEDRVRLRKRALRARLEVEKLERDRLLELLNPTEQNRIGEKPKMVKLTQLLMEQQHQQQGKPGAGAGASGTDAASPLSTLLALAKK